jgi:hypothetical protein
MSIMNVILLSTTPVAALGALLGLGRFEKWALEDRMVTRLAADPLEAAADPIAEAVQPEPLAVQPLHQAA